MIQIIETHAHIYSNEFDQDRDEVIYRAKANGVGKIYMPNIDSQSIVPMIHCEEKYPDLCIPMIGLHPGYVDEHYRDELAIIESWLIKRPFAAIGEVGIDLYHDKTFFSLQEEAFELQCKWAFDYSLPLVIHSRSAFYETVRILKKFPIRSKSGVFHCFGGSIQDAEVAISLGFYLGIGGTATYKNSGLNEVLPKISLENIILETDCPYLPPVPNRGKRNEPSYLPLIASHIAAIKGISFEEVAFETTRNANELFKDRLK